MKGSPPQLGMLWGYWGLLLGCRGMFWGAWGCFWGAGGCGGGAGAGSVVAAGSGVLRALAELISAPRAAHPPGPTPRRSPKQIGGKF